MNHKGCVNMVEECIKKEIMKISGKQKVSVEERDKAIEFVFGDGIGNFISMHEIDIDLKKLRTGIIVYLLEKGTLCELLKKKAT